MGKRSQRFRFYKRREDSYKRGPVPPEKGAGLEESPPLLEQGDPADFDQLK